VCNVIIDFSRLETQNMLGLRLAIISIVLATLIFSIAGDKEHARHRYDSDEESNELCSNDPSNGALLPPCKQPSIMDPSLDDNNPDASLSLTHENWCRSGNGTYFPLGSTFMLTSCTTCQCTLSRAIHCSTSQCLPAYCIDNSMPVRQEGQCCARCVYEKVTDTCFYNGTRFQHGLL
jgi:hypothetical protein